MPRTSKPANKGKQPATKRKPTVAELAADLIGSLEGPGDLSANPKYMEGYGQPNRLVQPTGTRPPPRAEVRPRLARSRARSGST